MAKKEEEKRRKAEEDRLKREKLMEMRSKDKKAKGRVNRMLKLTKSANKSAMADAVDSLNDSLVDQNGEILDVFQTKYAKYSIYNHPTRIPDAEP